jgi:hypothetical protein
MDDYYSKPSVSSSVWLLNIFVDMDIHVMDIISDSNLGKKYTF